MRQKLVDTRKRMEDILAGGAPADDDVWYETTEALAEPLLACYWSLWECGSGIVAEGATPGCCRPCCVTPGPLPECSARAVSQPATKHTCMMHSNRLLSSCVQQNAVLPHVLARAVALSADHMRADKIAVTWPACLCRAPAGPAAKGVLLWCGPHEDGPAPGEQPPQ